MPRPETERSIEKHLSRRVTEEGGLSFKFSSPSRRGVPDRIVLLKGRVFFVELKTANGKLTAAQERIRDLLQQYGCGYCLLRSKAEVDAWLASLFSTSRRQRKPVSEPARALA